ncbi:MAG: hypothetical protein BAJALOKI1v1_440026 [Promethearchaeota archaeon]|nr:MAG: hypothetical protein BAJALOKI1v1_440026 [Candidatus Lokiarchaeota archaeon]
MQNPYGKFYLNYYHKEEKPDFYNEFKTSIHKIEKILDLKLEINDNATRKHLMMILYANVITAMEVYLSDWFIRKLVDNKKFIPKLLEINNLFPQEKMTLRTAYDWFNTMDDKIIEVLSNFTFHNLGRVKLMYKDVLNIEFPDKIDEIFRAIQKRHDIIHRNGKTKDGSELNISRSEITNLISVVSRFADAIESQVIKI